MTSRLLVIGGTQFLGWHVVDRALAAGWQVTTLNRGESGPDDPRVTAVHGDRAEAETLAVAAEAGPFDLVVDTCGYVPRVVLAGARALEPVTGRYVFVSSISAHPMPYAGPPSEDSPVSECPSDAGPEDGDYGVLKAGCENAVTEVLGDRAVVVRPGLILGPRENVGRLPWWLQRMARGGDVLAPGGPERPFQVVDVRDLAVFCLAAGNGAGAAFDVTGPAGRDAWGDFLGLSAEVTGAGARLRWTDDADVLAAGVEPWTELPLWLPDDPEAAFFFDVVTDRACAAGFTARPLGETVADTWAWLQTLTEPYRGARDHGIDPAKEAAILAP